MGEGPFTMLSDAECLAILGELEASTEEIESPNVWVRKQAFRKVGRAMTQVDMLNRGAPGKIGLMEAIDPDKVRGPLSMIPEETSLEILRELDSKALEIEDPTSWIVSATEKHITPVAVKLHYINETLDLQEMIRIPGVLDALTEIDEAVALQILRKFENIYARIRKPTGWMRVQAQRSQYPPLVANKVMAKAPFFPGLRRPPGQRPMLRAPLSASRGQITAHMAANHAALAGEKKRKAH